jgi:hypothetical protein
MFSRITFLKEKEKPMLKKIAPFLFSVLLLSPICGQAAIPDSPLTPKQVELRDDMRKVWEEHINWARDLTVSAAEGLKDEKYVAGRFFRVTNDLSTIWGRYYPQEAADHIADLFNGHLTIAVSLVGALASGNKADSDKFGKQWYDNGRAMADYYADINPYLDRQEMQAMRKSHLDAIARMVSDRLGKKYSDGIAAVDDLENKALDMADYLSNGIMLQFPEKFE